MGVTKNYELHSTKRPTTQHENRTRIPGTGSAQCNATVTPTLTSLSIWKAVYTEQKQKSNFSVHYTYNQTRK